MPVRGLIWVVFFLASLPVCFVRPFYGLLLWTVLAFLNPQWYTWSAGEWLPWALLVAIPTLVGSFAFVRTWDRLRSRETTWILILWGWFSITTVVSTRSPFFIHHSEDTWYQWGFVSKVLIMALLALPLVDTFAKLRILVITIAGCFGFFVLKSFPFIIATGGAFRLYGPPHSMIADNNDLGLALDMSLPLFFFLALTETGWTRRLFGLIFLLTIPAVFFTYSRGALVGLVVVVFLMFLRLKQRWLLIPIIGGGIAIGLVFAPPAWKNRMNPTRPGAVDGSARARLVAWEYARTLAADFPISGGGFQTFTAELLSHYGYDAKDVHGPHSIYFEVLAEHGYVGEILYFCLVISCFLTGRRVVIMARAYDKPVLVNYANMFRFSLIGFLSSGVFLGRAYFDYFFTIVVCLAILKRVTDEECAKADEVCGDEMDRSMEPLARTAV